MLFRTYTKLLFSLSLIVLVGQGCKQTSPSPEQKDMFLKFYSDAYENEAVDMIQKDNSIYLLVNHTDGNDNRWVVLRCVDTYGNVQWEQRYGNQPGNTNNWAHRIVELSSNNLAIIGTSESDKDTLFTDVKLTIIDQNLEGKVDFDSVYKAADYDEGFCFTELTNDRYLLLGTKHAEESNTILKYRLVLDSEFNIVVSATDGDIKYEALGGIEVDENGKIFLPGNIDDQGRNIASIHELDNNGISINPFPVTQSFAGFYQDVDVINYPKMIACGYKESGSNGGRDAYLAMIDFDTKAIDWNIDFGGNASDDAVSAIYTANNDILMAGKQYRNGNSDIFVLRVDSKGASKDTLYFGGTDDEYSIKILPDTDNPNAFLVFGTSVRNGYSFSMLLKSKF